MQAPSDDRRDEPCVILVEPGQRYLWCACGLSQCYPFCDGTHAVTPHQPVVHEPKKKEYLFFCGCGRTREPPFCDGTHRF